MNTKGIFLSLWIMIYAISAHAELMTVQDLKTLLDTGAVGETAATSYIQGVVEGMIGMDSLYHKEKGTPFEFCKLQAGSPEGKPTQHPAFQTRRIIESWEKHKYPMNTLAIDMMLMHLTAQYGCSEKNTVRRNP